MRTQATAPVVVLASVALTLLMTSACSKPEPQPDPVRSPVDGEWREVARIPCDGGEEFVPLDPIGELILLGDFIRLTWDAFETNVDYRGSYKFDADAGTITLYDLEGSDVPNDVDGSGRFEITTGLWQSPMRKEPVESQMLVLRDMWLGTSHNNQGQGAACGHRFVPR